MVVILLRKRRAMLEETYRYLQHPDKISEIFSKDNFKKFSAENRHFPRFSSEYPESWMH